MAPEILAAMIGLAVLAPAVWLYNRLVADRNLARQGFADIDVQLKRRADLVPPLVEAVRADAAHAKTQLTSLAQVR
jgi:LemA protein